jgi:hypothetical protein
MLTILAGLPEGETVFEYLAGCWKRLNVANRDLGRIVRIRHTLLTLGIYRGREIPLEGS